MIQKLKLKKYVMPTVYVVAVITIALSVIVIGKSLQNMQPLDQNSSLKEEINDNSLPVVGPSEQSPAENIPTNVIKPFNNEKVTIIKEFYDKDASEAVQTKALIFYEGTYMQNSGILYSGESEFEVIAPMDGKISNIKEDELLGMVIEIEHNAKLRTIYQSLKETKVSVGDTVKQGDIIGVSGQNNIDKTSKNELLFEVYKDGVILNPAKFYEMRLEDLTE